MEVILHVGGVCWVSTIGRVVNHVPEMLYGTSKKGKTFSHALTLFYRGETPAFNTSVLISTSKLEQTYSRVLTLLYWTGTKGTALFSSPNTDL